jgi:hypothetical protein
MYKQLFTLAVLSLTTIIYLGNVSSPPQNPTITNLPQEQVSTTKTGFENDE